MREINTVTISGTLTGLELKEVGEAFPVLRATIAGDLPTPKAPTPFYLPVQLRGAYATTMSELLTDGAHVHALGHLESHTWSKDGQARTSTTLVLDTVKLLPPDQATSAPDKGGLARLANAENRAQLSGNLVRDPVSHTYRGHDLTRFTLAVKSGYGEKERTHFIEVITKDPAAKGLRKGDSALAAGAIERPSWTDKEGGKVRITRLNAATITPLARPSRRQAA